MVTSPSPASAAWRPAASCRCVRNRQQAQRHALRRRDADVGGRRRAQQQEAREHQRQQEDVAPGVHGSPQREQEERERRERARGDEELRHAGSGAPSPCSTRATPTAAAASSIPPAKAEVVGERGSRCAPGPGGRARIAVNTQSLSSRTVGDKGEVRAGVIQHHHLVDHRRARGGCSGRPRGCGSSPATSTTATATATRASWGPARRRASRPPPASSPRARSCRRAARPLPGPGAALAPQGRRAAPRARRPSLRRPSPGVERRRHREVRAPSPSA